MKYAAAGVEIFLLVVLMLICWVQIEAARDNRPAPLAEQQGDAFRQAEVAYQQGDMAQASLGYWYALKLDQQNTAARIRLAGIYQSRLHSWESQALKLVDEALQFDPESVEARLLKGKILRNQGESELATIEFQRVLRSVPDQPEVNYQLGTINEGRREYEQAIHHYQQAIAGDAALTLPEFEAHPFGIQARLQLARLHRRQRQFDRAIEALEETVALAPDYTEAKAELVPLLFNRADQLIREGADPGTQLAAYRRILKADPRDPEAWYRIGQIHEHYQNEFEKAMEAYQTAYDLDPTYADPLLAVRSLELRLAGEPILED